MSHSPHGRGGQIVCFQGERCRRSWLRLYSEDITWVRRSFQDPAPFACQASSRRNTLTRLRPTGWKLNNQTVPAGDLSELGTRVRRMTKCTGNWITGQDGAAAPDNCCQERALGPQPGGAALPPNAWDRKSPGRGRRQPMPVQVQHAVRRSHQGSATSTRLRALSGFLEPTFVDHR